MLQYRLSHEVFATSLSGRGAALRGGRWNSAGVEMCYTADSPALSMVEVRVHLVHAMIIPTNYVVVTIYVPDDIFVQELDASLLKRNWNSIEAYEHTQKLGDAFIAAGKACILKVPSAIVKGFNFLINPAHPDFANIRIASIEPFVFDERMFQ